MDYKDVASARSENGLRLVLTAGVPGPWSEAAKAVFKLRDVPFTPVAQMGGGLNPELVDWTRHRNAPVALYNDEAPRVRWLEIVELAERLGSGDSLLPETMEERMRVVGIVNEIAGESGFAWFGRHLMLAGGHEAQGDKVLSQPMYQEYGYGDDTLEYSIERVKLVLDMLSEQLAGQHAVGSSYFVGHELSAADVYWAYFSQLLRALPEEDNPMPAGLRKAWGQVARALDDYDTKLIDQRDFVFAEHLELPLSF